jgi:predicted flap endonuclease-1-like 5' DNA nuclease
MSYKVEEIEGIGGAIAQKLAAAGIKTTDALLEACKDAKGRKATAEATGLDEKRLLKWANMADLMRIKGVGKQFSELLEAAGVDTVKELKTRNAANLAARMAEVNEAKNLCNAVPAESVVAGWVEQAKQLPAMLSY